MASRFANTSEWNNKHKIKPKKSEGTEKRQTFCDERRSNSLREERLAAVRSKALEVAAAVEALEVLEAELEALEALELEATVEAELEALEVPSPCRRSIINMFKIFVEKKR